MEQFKKYAVNVTFDQALRSAFANGDDALASIIMSYVERIKEGLKVNTRQFALVLRCVDVFSVDVDDAADMAGYIACYDPPRLY